LQNLLLARNRSWSIAGTRFLGAWLRPVVSSVIMGALFASTGAATTTLASLLKISGSMVAWSVFVAVIRWAFYL
jgi:hypothetical protein